MDKSDQVYFEKALEIISIIEKQGYAALIVGGAVRDLVMGRHVPDIDLATDMPLQKLSAVFRTHDIGKSKDFGIMCIEYGDEHFETSFMFRAGEYYSGNISPGERTMLLFSMDARRRDFTINAMAMDAGGLILDPLEGRRDISRRLIRTVREPEHVFRADPLRLLRAIRFACGLGFEMEQQTFECIKELSPLILDVAAERVGIELMRLSALKGKDFAKGLALMDGTGLLEQILPEIYRLKKFDHDPEHHPEGGVYRHTLAALRANEGEDSAVNLSILFHDCGKPEAYGLKHGRPAYHRHEMAGEGVIRTAGQRLKLPGKLVQTMCFVAANHMKGSAIGQMKPSKVFRLMTDPNWPVLKEVVRCDLMARSEHKALGFEREVSRLSKELSMWLEKQQSGSRPVVTGREVMEYTGLSQGPEVGRILEQVTSWAIDNQINDTRQIREYILNCIYQK